MSGLETFWETPVRSFSIPLNTNSASLQIHINSMNISENDLCMVMMSTNIKKEPLIPLSAHKCQSYVVFHHIWAAILNVSFQHVPFVLKFNKQPFGYKWTTSYNSHFKVPSSEVITARQGSWVKVMFSQVFFCLLGVGILDSMSCLRVGISGPMSFLRVGISGPMPLTGGWVGTHGPRSLLEGGMSGGGYVQGR